MSKYKEKREEGGCNRHKKEKERAFWNLNINDVGNGYSLVVLSDLHERIMM